MAVLFIIVLALGTVVSANMPERAVSISPNVIPGNGVNECPSNEDRQAARQLLQSITNQVLQNYSSNNPNCGHGHWRQVFYFNVSNEGQSCPGDWNARTVTSVRGCAGSDISCQSAFSGAINIAYNRVCGRVFGIGSGTPDGFIRFISGQTTIEDNYLDGVSITHGASGSRTHIWSFGAGHPSGRYMLAALVTTVMVTLLHYLLLKWERTTSVVPHIQAIVFGLEVSATLLALAVPFTILDSILQCTPSHTNY